MANQFVINEIPATTNQWFAQYRLYQTLKLAGWTVVSSGNGVTSATSDLWAASFAGLVADSWIVMQGRGGRQILFHRSGVSTTRGEVRYSKSIGWSGAGTATAPPADPSDSADIRGTSGVSDALWQGASGSLIVSRLNIMALDATTDSSFFIHWSATVGGYDVGGRFGMELLTDASTGDTDPYVFFTPEADTGSWGDDLDDYEALLREDGTASTTGVFRGWYAAGQSGEEFIHYGSGVLYLGDIAVPETTGVAIHEAADDAVPYFATPRERLWTIGIGKQADSPARVDVKGRTQNFGVASSFTPSLSTFNSGAFAKPGSLLWVRWNGTLTDPIA